MKTVAKISTPLLLALALLIGCAGQEVTQPLDEVTVQLRWSHQAQFAGFYAADQQGYYIREGLAVHLLPRSAPNADVITPVVNGTADFGLGAGVQLVTARAQGQPITAIAAIYRRSPLVFITMADSGITRPHDFPGHTMRFQNPGGGAAVFQAMMTRLGLDPDSVRSVEAGYDMAPFFGGEIDIWPAFITDEVLVAREQGYQVNVILPSDYGVHTYGDTLFTTDRLIQENPDLVLRFLRATLQGWRWAIENPGEAGALSLRYDLTLDAAHEVALMEASVPLIHTGEGQIGWMRPQVWQGTYNMLLEQEVLDEPVDVDDIYTMTFLHRIYGAEQ